MLIDQGDDSYPTSGQAWPFADIVFVNPAITNTGTVPFALNFGDGIGAANHKFVFDTNGQITFLDASNNSDGQFIAPLLSPTGFKVDDGTGGFMSYGPGTVDPQLLGAPGSGAPFDINDGLAAYRFLWRFVCSKDQNCDFNTTDLTFEAILVDRSAGNAVGDFDLDFFYDTLNGVIPGDATGGFSLGGSTAPIAQFSDPGPDFCFRGGKAADCGRATTPIPEPETLPLVVGGIAVLASLRRRRSRVTSHADA